MFTINNEKKSPAIIPLTVLAGAVIGSAITLLLAPKKGSESRKWLMDKTKDLRSLFGNAFMESMHEDQTSLQSSKEAINAPEKNTMHAVRGNRKNEEHLSKTDAIVNRLKHTKQDHNGRPEPM